VRTTRLLHGVMIRGEKPRYTGRLWIFRSRRWTLRGRPEGLGRKLSVYIGRSSAYIRRRSCARESLRLRMRLSADSRKKGLQSSLHAAGAGWKRFQMKLGAHRKK